METLPADVWRDRILPQLRLHDLVELRAVCHALYDIVESCLPWKDAWQLQEDALRHKDTELSLERIFNASSGQAVPRYWTKKVHNPLPLQQTAHSEASLTFWLNWFPVHTPRVAHLCAALLIQSAQHVRRFLPREQSQLVKVLCFCAFHNLATSMRILSLELHDDTLLALKPDLAVSLLELTSSHEKQDSSHELLNVLNHKPHALQHLIAALGKKPQAERSMLMPLVASCIALEQADTELLTLHPAASDDSERFYDQVSFRDPLWIVLQNAALGSSSPLTCALHAKLSFARLAVYSTMLLDIECSDEQASVISRNLQLVSRFPLSALASLKPCSPSSPSEPDSSDPLAASFAQCLVFCEPFSLLEARPDWPETATQWSGAP